MSYLMAMTAGSIVDWVIMVAVFGLVVALWVMGVLFWLARRSSRSRQLEGRLGLGMPDDGETRVLRLWKEGREETVSVSVVGARSLLSRLDQLCREASWQMPVQTLLLALFGSTTLVFVVVFTFTDSLVPALGMACVVLLLFWAYLKMRINHRLILFESQFAEALELAARSLRAGHPLVGAFRLVSEEMPAPVRTIFAEVCQLQGLGVSLEEAIRRGADRSGSNDMRLFATSVIIQLRSGGNLADMMHRLALVIRDRIRMKRRIRVLTAQTRLSKYVLMALPFGLFVLLNVLKPDYMALLYQTQTGRSMLVMAAVGVVLGAWLMNRLTVLKY